MSKHIHRGYTRVFTLCPNDDVWVNLYRGNPNICMLVYRSVKNTYIYVVGALSKEFHCDFDQVLKTCVRESPGLFLKTEGGEGYWLFEEDSIVQMGSCPDRSESMWEAYRIYIQNYSARR